jgi:outer membrane receptor for ferrienterochelin and colicins
MSSALIITVVLAAAVNSHSLPDADNAARILEPDHFARYAPSTALDMVQQIEGFSIATESTERGLGQAEGNVLINGRRISGKSNDAISALSRISASSVVRIEIVDGASMGISGLSGQVVNVVTQAAELSGSVTWNPEFRDRREANLGQGIISLNGSWREFEFSLSVRERGIRVGDTGPEWVRDASGTLIDFRDEDEEYTTNWPVLSASLSREFSNGVMLNLSGEYNSFNMNGREHSIRSGPGLPDRYSLFLQGSDLTRSEIGGDIEFDALDGRLKLIGLIRDRQGPAVYEQNLFFLNGTPRQASRFSNEVDEGERILRAEYSRSTEDGRTWQIALEGAFNFNDIASALAFYDAATGTFQPVSLPNSASRVEENRAEISLTHSRRLSPQTRLQLSLGGEYSELSQSGPTGNQRSFLRPWGYLALTHNPDESSELRARIERSVGQLSFPDFVASVDVNNNNNNAGNPDLVPPQTLRAELEAQRRFGEAGTLEAEVFWERIDDIVDIIPIGTNGQSVGNLNQATNMGMAIGSTLNGAPFGWNGGRLTTRVEAADSSLTDPATGADRPTNGQMRLYWSVDFRHDIEGTDWAWGAGGADYVHHWSYRLDQRTRFALHPAQAFLFIENKDVLGANVRVRVRNLADAQDTNYREVYAGHRPSSLAYSEYRERSAGLIWDLRISRMF